ncbi:MAG: DUF2459 domain-containing protein [Bacteroidales bacterium]|nr:DUF2459 domain-containing protein [Bacteroidales bacterium]
MVFSFKIFILSLAFVCHNNVGYTSYSEQNNVNEYNKIYVVKHRWHSGIILNRSETKELLPALGIDFSNSQYIEIGWGDKDFYMAEKGTLSLAFKAVLWPTESVIHVAEISSHQLEKYSEGEIIQLELTEDNFAKLMMYFNSSFYLDDNHNNIKYGRGLYGNSQFYLSNEQYHLFKTCNVWVAKALKNANISINPFFAFTSKNVMRQLRKTNKKSVPVD